MSNAVLTIRHKLYDFIRVADEKKLYAIYHLIENDIEQGQEWWKDKSFTTELGHRSMRQWKKEQTKDLHWMGWKLR